MVLYSAFGSCTSGAHEDPPGPRVRLPPPAAACRLRPCTLHLPQTAGSFLFSPQHLLRCGVCARAVGGRDTGLATMHHGLRCVTAVAVETDCAGLCAAPPPVLRPGPCTLRAVLLALGTVHCALAARYQPNAVGTPTPTPPPPAGCSATSSFFSLTSAGGQNGCSGGRHLSRSGQHQ
jgi:hypothetical protein